MIQGARCPRTALVAEARAFSSAENAALISAISSDSCVNFSSKYLVVLNVDTLDDIDYFNSFIFYSTLSKVLEILLIVSAEKSRTRSSLIAIWFLHKFSIFVLISKTFLNIGSMNKS